MYGDDVPKFEDAPDDETPEQRRVADDDAAAGVAEAMNLTIEEARKLLGLAESITT